MRSLSWIMADNGTSELPESTRRANEQSAQQHRQRQARRQMAQADILSPLGLVRRLIQRAKELAAHAEQIAAWADDWAYGMPAESVSAVDAQAEMVLVTYPVVGDACLPIVFKLRVQMIVVDGEAYSVDIVVQHPSHQLLGAENVAHLMEVADVNSIACVLMAEFGLQLSVDESTRQNRHLALLCPEAAAADEAMREVMDMAAVAGLHVLRPAA